MEMSHIERVRNEEERKREKRERNESKEGEKERIKKQGEALQRRILHPSYGPS
jgi:hypothetical protein